MSCDEVLPMKMGLFEMTGHRSGWMHRGVAFATVGRFACGRLAGRLKAMHSGGH